jgi:hypothetical protein
MFVGEPLQTYVKPAGDRVRIEKAIENGRWQAFMQIKSQSSICEQRPLPTVIQEKEPSPKSPHEQSDPSLIMAQPEQASTVVKHEPNRRRRILVVSIT